ncbi:MAG: PhnD/SsuA/transferrin family substrate-binding protein [Chloroflexi bacterium]|nr:PhnD/SsuA/transferrin family substrate-binding protein [Chloroflexota bacterium]
MYTPVYFRLVLLIVCLLGLAACREQAAQVAPVIAPTLTPTPRSTPLPAVPTAIPPGDEGNAIRMVIRPLGPAADARSAASDFEAAVLERSGVVIEVELVDRYAEGLAALCGSAGGQVSIAWLNGPAYIAARAQNCGVPALQVERDGATGEAGSIIVSADSRQQGLQQLRGSTFCRLGNDDFYSWFVPSLVIRANGLDAANTPQEVVEQDDLPALVRAVGEGDCDAAGAPASAVNEDDPVKVIETTIPFPYAVLMIPSEVPLGKRLALVDALTETAADRGDAITMRLLLAQDALVPASVDDFAELTDYLNSTGLDFAQLGN